MVFFDLLKTFIFLVSSVLLYPVLILLSASAVYIIWSAGRFLGEWMERARCGGFDPAKDSPQEFRFPLPVRRYREMLKHLDLHDDAAVAYLMRQAVAERQGARKDKISSAAGTVAFSLQSVRRRRKISAYSSPHSASACSIASANW